MGRPLRMARKTLEPLLAGATLGLVAVFAQAACAASLDPCALASVAEVTVAVGSPVGPGRRADNGATASEAQSTTCLWVTPLEEGQPLDPSQRFGGRGFVLVNLMQWPGPTQARTFLSEFDRAFERNEIDSRPTPVDVGAEEAVWWGDGVAGRKGSVSFGISVAQFGEREERQAQAERIARIVAARLP